MRDLGLLILRMGAGGLLAGHGAQKLFGWFGGHGLQGTGGWLESIGLKPGARWAVAAGGGEFGSGLLTALGLFNPLGPIALIAPMAVATGKVHWNKPIWVSEGGAELPAMNTLVGVALALTGPGRYSLDRMFGIRLPMAFSLLAAGAVAAGAVAALRSHPEVDARSPEAETAGAELQAGASAS